MSIFDSAPSFFQNIQVPSHSDKKIKHVRLYRCPCYPDGSCFFHAVLLATSVGYRNASTKERCQICADFRNRIADYLHSEIQVRFDNNEIGWICVYSYLSRGQLNETSRILPQFSLKNLDILIRSNEAVGLEVIELVSLYLDINIYILRTQKDNKGDNVYNPGDANFLYPSNRKSIVLYYNGDHFDLCAINHPSFPGEFATFFLPSNPLVQYVREKLLLKEAAQ